MEPNLTHPQNISSLYKSMLVHWPLSTVTEVGILGSPWVHRPLKHKIWEWVHVESTSQDFYYDKPFVIQIVRMMKNVMMTNISTKCFSSTIYIYISRASILMSSNQAHNECQSLKKWLKPIWIWWSWCFPMRIQYWHAAKTSRRLLEHYLAFISGSFCA